MVAQWIVEYVAHHYLTKLEAVDAVVRPVEHKHVFSSCKGSLGITDDGVVHALGGADVARRHRTGIHSDADLHGGLAAGGPISGSIILALLGYPDPLSFSRGFIVCSVFVMVALFLVLLFVREPKHIHVTAVEPRRTNRTPALDPTFLRLLAIGLVITLALGLIVPILTLFGTNVLRVSLYTFALILIPPALTAAVVLIPAGRWADKRGRETPMLLGLCLIAIPFWGAALSTQPLVVSAGGMVAALGYALLVPAWNAFIMDWIPDRRRGLFLGGIATVQGIGLAAGPVIGGRLFELNPYAPFWLAGTLLAVGAALAAWVAYRPAQIRESDSGESLSDR